MLTASDQNWSQRRSRNEARLSGVLFWSPVSPGAYERRTRGFIAYKLLVSLIPTLACTYTQLYQQLSRWKKPSLSLLPSCTHTQLYQQLSRWKKPSPSLLPSYTYTLLYQQLSRWKKPSPSLLPSYTCTFLIHFHLCPHQLSSNLSHMPQNSCTHWECRLFAG